jgi:dihydroorotase
MLIRKAKIVDQSSPYHLQQKDILIKQGIIVKIDDNIQVDNEEIIEMDDLHISIGWMDIGTVTCEPGYEHREDLNSLSEAAIAGGYTSLAIFPNTNPPIHSRTDVLSIISQSKDLAVNIIPIGSISQNIDGEDISEMMDMHYSGVIAYSDGLKSIQNNGLMLRALEYSQTVDKIIINRPFDKYLKKGAEVHEGRVAIQLGLDGQPSIAESLMLERDINLVNYSNGKYHAYAISTAESTESISNAKKLKLRITTSVAAMNLCFTDENLLNFDSNYKVQPPLRDDVHRIALHKGLKNNTIDAIVSGHVPWDDDEKNKEFPYTQSGVINIQTAFSMLMTYADNLSLELIIDKISAGPRKVLDLEKLSIIEGSKAELTLFSPNSTWEYTKQNNASKSKNSPLLGKKLKGKVYGIINKNKIVII